MDDDKTDKRPGIPAQTPKPPPAEPADEAPGDQGSKQTNAGERS